MNFTQDITELQSLWDAYDKAPMESDEAKETLRAYDAQLHVLAEKYGMSTREVADHIKWEM